MRNGPGADDDPVLVVRSEPDSSELDLVVMKVPAGDLAASLLGADVVARIQLDEPGASPDVVARVIVESLSTSEVTLGPQGRRVLPELAEPRGRTTSRASLLAQAQRYIEANLHDDDLSPAMVAEAIHVSRRYVHVIFKEAGLSVSRFIRARRMDRGRQRLADHKAAHLSIADIAAHLGFKDASHFARVFKATYGVTPREFRSRRARGRASGRDSD